MLFCITANYTPQALNAILANPDSNRLAAVSNLVEAAGGKVLSLYSTAADGPGVLAIIDVPDPSAAPAISGIVVASGAVQNVRLTRLLTQDEVRAVRHKAVQLRPAYKAPGQ